MLSSIARKTAAVIFINEAQPFFNSLVLCAVLNQSNLEINGCIFFVKPNLKMHFITVSYIYAQDSFIFIEVKIL